MHLTRPKSSKGRSRPAARHTGDPDHIQGPPASPDSPVHGGPDGHLRSQSQPVMWQAGQLSQDQVLQMLQQAPAAPPQSLNKYKVLPSIEKRQAGASPASSLDTHMSMLSLQHRREEPELPAVAQTNRPEGHKRADVHLGLQPKASDPAPIATKEPGTSGSLLLAIRAPCGRRFQQHFEPSDTLLTVRASAEVRYRAKYGDASIETMDVPRRTFTDMDLTLAQCGILNRSVLCVSLNDSEQE